MAKCICMSPPFFYKNFDEQFIGTDMTDSRYGEVSIKICKKCGRKWLHFLVEPNPRAVGEKPWRN